MRRKNDVRCSGLPKLLQWAASSPSQRTVALSSKLVCPALAHSPVSSSAGLIFALSASVLPPSVLNRNIVYM
jgi:hypothetical protein